MANIDTTTIEGYESMTPEEKVQVLEAFNFPDFDTKGFVKKETFDKVSSDLAALKKKNKELIDNHDNEDVIGQLREELAALKKDKQLVQLKANYTAIGYDEESAEKAAKAMQDNDYETLFNVQKAFLNEHDKSMKIARLNGTPKPGAISGKSITKDEIMKIKDSAERQSMIAENLQLFDKGE